MASFKAKIGWKRRRNRENKNCLSVPFVLDGKYKIPGKNKKMPLWLHFKPKQVGKGREIEKIKNAVPFRSHPTRSRKFQKNRRKFKKIQKIQLWLHFKPKQDGKGPEREKKNYRFVSFRTDVLEKIQEKQQKNSIN